MEKDVSVSSEFKRNSIICFVGFGIYVGFQWLINIVVVRVLGYNDAGNLSLAIAATSNFYVIAHFNVRTYQVSDYSNQFSSKEYIGQRFINCLAAMVLCVVYSLICGYSDVQLSCIIVYMAFKLTEAVLDVFHGILQKNYRLDVVGYSYILRGVTTFALFLIGLLVTHKIVVGMLVMFAGSLALLFIFEIPRSARLDSVTPEFNFGSMLKIYKKSVWVFVYYFAFNMLTIMPRSILEYYHGSETLGIFGSVASPVFIIQLSATLILTPIVNLMTEDYSKRNSAKFRKTCIVGASAIFAMCLVILAAAYFFGDWFLRLLIGESIQPYTYIFIPLVVSTVFLVYSNLISNILTVIRDAKGLILSACFGLVPCAVTSVTLIPKCGIDGVVVTMIISFASMAFFSLVYTLVRLKKVFKVVD